MDVKQGAQNREEGPGSVIHCLGDVDTCCREGERQLAKKNGAQKCTHVRKRRRRRKGKDKNVEAEGSKQTAGSSSQSCGARGRGCTGIETLHRTDTNKTVEESLVQLLTLGG